jgi:hypothetical protein
MESLPRPATLQKLKDFAAGEGAGLVFVRGRRRVGKTWLLQELEQELGQVCFRLVCRRHKRDSVVLREVAQDWIQFSGRAGLGLIKTASLTWKMLLDEIGEHAMSFRQDHGRPMVLVIDEVQWLSTGYEESAGVIKAAWDEWAKGGAIRVILCGSSSRFFTEQFGEGSVLRGLQTRAMISVMPFPLAILKRFALPGWSLNEAVLGYMCLGGIPYYWQRIAAKKGFRRAMNEACCTSASIMLDEWREIIATEFRTDAVESLNRLFPALLSADEGVTLHEVAERLGMAPATVGRLLEKLTSYGYVLRSLPELDVEAEESSGAKIARGARYVLCDFYLHFYFSVLRPMEHEIRSNADGLLFPSQILQGETKEYIPTFTGKAFERFVYHHIDVSLRSGEWQSFLDKSPKLNLWQILDLPDANYDVSWNVLIRGDSSDKIRSQIDVLIVHEKERAVRVIECKWKSAGARADIDDVKGKTLPKRYGGYARRDFLAVSYQPTKSLAETAAQEEVTLITLDAFV